MKFTGLLWAGFLVNIFLPLASGNHIVPSTKDKSIVPENCPNLVFTLDSAYSYIYITNLQEWQLNTRHTYFYTQTNRNDYWIVNKFPGPIRNSKVDFVYNNDNMLIMQFYQRWIGDTWKSIVMVEFFHDSKQLLDSLRVSSWDFTAEEWKPSQIQVYFYDVDNRIQYYLTRQKDDNGNWYDYLYRNYLYNSSGQIIEWYNQLVDGGSIIFRSVNSYTYNEQDKITETINKILSPETGKLVNYSKSVIDYDVF